MENGLQQLEKIFDIFLSRGRLIVSCLLISIAGGLTVYLNIPKTYTAATLILYQQQSINPTRMSPDVKARLDEMVDTVTQEVTSRSSLEKMITKFELYQELRNRLPMEDVVETMRQHIAVKKEKGEIFEVSYRGGDPRKVMLITNELASRFIEANLRFREMRASETYAYVKDELEMARKIMDQRESAMRDYKLRYYNEMPERQQMNLGMLTTLQGQKNEMQSNIQDLERTRLMIQEQINLRRELLDLHDGRLKDQQMPAGSGAGEDMAFLYQQDGGARELATARQQLSLMLNRYTEDHPDVRRLQRKIQDLGGSQGFDSAAADGLEEAWPADLSGSGEDVQLQQLTRQLRDTEYTMAKLKKEREEIAGQISTYQSRVEAAPVREAEWSALTRDYDKLNQHYQELVAQNLAARSAQELERRQKGSQFKIIDPAHFPEKPSTPDFLKIMLAAMVLGLGLGGGLAYGLATVDPAVNDLAELEQYRLPVICTIPTVKSPVEQKREKVQSLLWKALFALSFTGVASAMIVLFQKGYLIF